MYDTYIVDTKFKDLYGWKVLFTENRIDSFYFDRMDLKISIFCDQITSEGSVAQWIAHHTMNTWMTLARRGFEPPWCQNFCNASCAPEQGTLLLLFRGSEAT